MFSNPLQTFCRMALLGVAAALAAPQARAAAPTPANPAKSAGDEPRPPTVAEKLDIARNPAKHSSLRVKAIENLNRCTEKEIQDNRLVDELLDIVNKASDMFVRVEAIKTLGDFQTNFPESKTKYIEPFMALLRSDKEYPQVRKAVAQVFKKTLDPKGLKDEKACQALVEIVKNRQEAIPLKIEAAAAIAEFGKSEGIKSLSELLSDPEQLVKEAAAKAIYRILVKLPETSLDVVTVNRLGALMDDAGLPPDILVAVMRVMAQLIRDGNMQAKNLALSKILEMPKKASSDVIVLGAIEAMGIIGSEDSVGPLNATYEFYLDKKDYNKAGDLPIRRAVAEAYSTILMAQSNARTPNMKIVKDAAALLVGMVDNDESPAVKSAAIFNIRYLYDRKFADTHKVVFSALIGFLNKTKDEGLKNDINKTLEALTALTFTDHRRWDEWFKDKFK
jgi:HEAT repeat protein